MNFDDALRETEREDSSRISAAQDMDRQVEIALRHGAPFSLDSMWRAVGSPTRKDPRSWLHLAWPLIVGVAEYHKNLDEFKGMPGFRRLDWSPDDIIFVLARDVEPGSAWHVGDVMGLYFAAMAYARFLDNDDYSG